MGFWPIISQTRLTEGDQTRGGPVLGSVFKVLALAHWLAKLANKSLSLPSWRSQALSITGPLSEAWGGASGPLTSKAGAWRTVWLLRSLRCAL